MCWPKNGFDPVPLYDQRHVVEDMWFFPFDSDARSFTICSEHPSSALFSI